MNLALKEGPDRNKTRLLLKLFSPVFAVIILLATDADFYLYPIVFSLAVSLTNLENLKTKIFIGIVLSIIFSYVSFFIGILGANIFDKALTVLGLQKEFQLEIGLTIDLVYTLSTFVLSPLAVFFLFKFIFEFPKTKITVWTKFIAIIVLIMNSMVPEAAFGLFNVFNFWQIIMILSLQIILNQRALVFPVTHNSH